MEEEQKVDSDKFEFLYDYKCLHLSILRDDYKELENKATKYLTFITFVLTIVTFLFRSYIIEPDTTKGILYYLSLALLFIYVISVFPPLRQLFLCIKISKLGDLPVDGVRQYFLDHSKETVYLGMSDRLDQIIDIYKKINLEKAGYLKNAFKEIKTCSIIFLLFIITFFANILINHPDETKNSDRDSETTQRTTTTTALSPSSRDR